MDKKKKKTIKEIRKKIGLQFQDRRDFLNALLNIANSEESIRLREEHLNQMKAELDSGVITERDRFGNTLTKEQLKREIVSVEFELRIMRLNLDYRKEDLYFKLYGKEGLIDKAGSLEKLKDQINGHFMFIRDEFEKIRKVLGSGDLNVI
jgi:hypothetical protein